MLYLNLSSSSFSEFSGKNILMTTTTDIGLLYVKMTRRTDEQW
jgi:hypothetical protein